MALQPAELREERCSPAVVALVHDTRGLSIDDVTLLEDGTHGCSQGRSQRGRGAGTMPP